MASTQKRDNFKKRDMTEISHVPLLIYDSKPLIA